MSTDERGLACSGSSLSPVGFRATPRRRRPARPEGGELGYALTHAYGAAFDNPDLLVCCVVGDGEAETGPLAASWHSNKFLSPKTDGAVLPILHLNGYKIANPTVLARIPEEELVALFEGYGHRPILVPATTRSRCTATSPLRSTTRSTTSPASRAAAPKWPMIVLRTPRAAGPKVVEGLPGGGHMALTPGADGRRPRTRSTSSSRSGCGATGRRSCSTRSGVAELAALPPKGDKRMSASPHTTGELGRDLVLPGFPRLRGRGEGARTRDERGDARARGLPARRDRAQPRDLPPLRPRRDGLEPAVRRLRGDEPGLGSGASCRRTRGWRPRGG